MKEKKGNLKDIEDVSLNQNNSNEKINGNEVENLEDLKEKIKSLEEENGELKSDYLRCRADFENFRKRKEKEFLELRERVISDFVLDLLPSIDNFEMALKMTDDKEMLIKGVEMIHSNLVSLLENHNFKPYVPGEGDRFDVRLHDPLLIESDEHEPGKIVETIQKGYMKGDRVIRPARVKVVKEKEVSSINEESENS